MSNKVESYKEFILRNREEINNIVSLLFIQQDNAVISKIKSAFDSSIKPCYQAYIKRSTGNLSQKHQEFLIQILKNLITSIKKRYYGFPDRTVVAVSQERLFDEIVPKLISVGLLDNTLYPFIILYNAGENLNQISAAFYTLFEQLIEYLDGSSSNIEDLIQICAWASGDNKRRKISLQILDKQEQKANIFLRLQFGHDLKDHKSIPKEFLKECKKYITDFLAADHWIHPRFAFPASYAKKILVNLNNGEYDDATTKLKRLMNEKSSIELIKAKNIVTLNSAGKYLGFSGNFESPPKVAGIVETGNLIAYTSSGKLFHVNFSASGNQIRTLGRVSAKDITYSNEYGIVIVSGSNDIIKVKDAVKIGSLPGSYQHVIGRICGKFIYYYSLAKKRIYRLDLTGDQDPKVNTAYIQLKQTILDLVAFKENLLIAILNSKTTNSYELIELKFGTSEKIIKKLKNKVKLAVLDDKILIIAEDGRVTVLNEKYEEENQFPARIKLDGLTSLFVTSREAIVTYDFTHRIYFLGTSN
ncbi:MAG: hypothetical protein ACTSUE_22025 [Promethearchaeota archaeon]